MRIGDALTLSLSSTITPDMRDQPSMLQVSTTCRQPGGDEISPRRYGGSPYKAWGNAGEGECVDAKTSPERIDGQPGWQQRGQQESSTIAMWPGPLLFLQPLDCHYQHLDLPCKVASWSCWFFDDGGGGAKGSTLSCTAHHGAKGSQHNWQKHHVHV